MTLTNTEGHTDRSEVTLINAALLSVLMYIKCTETERQNSCATGSLITQGALFSCAAENGRAVSKQEAGEDGPGQAQ